MSHYKIIAIISGSILVLAGLFFFRVGKENSLGRVALNFFTQVPQVEPPSGTQSTEVELPLGSSTSETSEIEPSASASASEEQIFTHTTYNFTFKYPKDFNASSFEDGEGDVVLVQSKDSKNGFQMYIMPFDEPGPITTERVKKDIPDMAIENPQSIFLKSDFRSSGGIPALIFFSQNESLGRTREVWFIWPEDPKLAGNYLYQVTAPAEFDEEFSKIMATLRFTE